MAPAVGSTQVYPAQLNNPQGFELYPHPLWNAYSGLILLAARIFQREPVAKSPDELRDLLQGALRVARDSAVRVGRVPMDDVNSAEFAVVVTLNEAANSLGGELGKAWASSPLKAQTGNVENGGHSFYTFLDRLEREGRDNVLWIFYFCLKVGFRGKLSSDDRGLKLLLDRLTSRLSKAASPDPLPPLIVQPPRVIPQSTSNMHQTQLITAICGGLLLGGVVLAWVTWSAGVLASELHDAAQPPKDPTELQEAGGE